MLTTTYSIMLLDGEQQKARGLVVNLEKYLHSIPDGDADVPDLAWFEQAVVRLMAAYVYSSERKIELYVIPSLKKLAHEAEALLDNLDHLNGHTARILGYVYRQFQRASGGACIDVETLLGTMQLFCRQMLERFALEEQRLLPLARRLLSEEDWFGIASQCLTHAEKHRLRCAAPAVPVAVARRRGEQRLLH